MRNEMLVDFYRENTTYFTNKKVLSFMDNGKLYSATLTEVSRNGDCFLRISSEKASTRQFEYLAHIDLRDIGNSPLCELENEIKNYISSDELRSYINEYGKERMNTMDLISYDWLDSTLPIFCYAEHPETHKTIRIVRGDDGFFDLPDKYKNVPAKKLNADLGITEIEANAMIQGSIHGWEREKIEPLLKKEKKSMFKRRKR